MYIKTTANSSQYLNSFRIFLSNQKQIKIKFGSIYDYKNGNILLKNHSVLLRISSYTEHFLKVAIIFCRLKKIQIVRYVQVNIFDGGPSGFDRLALRRR